MKQGQITASTCKYGHLWETTPSDSIRRCSARRCQAIQRLERGQWITIEPRSMRKRNRPAQAERRALFEERNYHS